MNQRGKLQALEPSARQRRTIRTHTKSRGGCLACKLRRIKVTKTVNENEKPTSNDILHKCSTTIPVCNACQKSNSPCIYASSTKPSIASSLLSSTRGAMGFSLGDMRLFHNFMTASYPHLPLGSHDAWLQEIPLLAQQHEFLMRAILCLGAAHLGAKTGIDFCRSMESNRTLALQGMNRQMELSPVYKTRSDCHASKLTAMLATCYILAFVASYNKDSVSSLFFLVRGCNSLTEELVRWGHSSPLLPTRSHTASIYQRLVAILPTLPPVDCEQALSSMGKAKAICTFKPHEEAIFQALNSSLQLIHNPFQGTTLILPKCPRIQSKQIQLTAPLSRFIKLYAACHQKTSSISLVPLGTQL